MWHKKVASAEENYIYDDLYGYSLGLLQGQGRTAARRTNIFGVTEFRGWIFEQLRETSETYVFLSHDAEVEQLRNPAVWEELAKVKCQVADGGGN